MINDLRALNSTPQVGVERRTVGRVTKIFAVCTSCVPQWSLQCQTKKGAERKAMLHAAVKHGWNPDQ